MWLLSTDRAELHHLTSPEAANRQGGYAILSHVWGAEEQSFEDVLRIQAQCASRKTKLASRLPAALSQSTNPRDYVSEKIRQSCIIAERLGYKWIWNDTCCIDKRSSAELSEAVNSMYRYYALAAVCLAYLADVQASPSADPTDPNTAAFRDSRWHKRGWTLQELIAPFTLVFLSNSWTPLGTKGGLVNLLESVTGVPASVLNHESGAMSRLTASWMANRTTTRVEDRAYCLLGILGINMATLYGEGDRAFLRLQEKIMKTSVDTSIFAWGAQIKWKDLCEARVEPTHDHENTHHYLLSASHGVFQRLGHVHSSGRPGLPYSPDSEEQPEEAPVVPSIVSVTETQSTRSERPFPHPCPTFSMTQHGLRCHIPVFRTPSFAVAALFCFDRSQGSELGLILTPCPHRSSPPLYHCGWTSPTDGLSIRIALLGVDSEALLCGGQRAVFKWEEIYIAPRPPPIPFTAPAYLLDPGPLLDLGPVFGGFRVPHSTFTALIDHGWIRVPHTKIRDYGWTVPHTFDLLFEREGPEGSHLIFALGRCSAGGSLPHWASFWLVPGELPEDHTPPSHRCPGDHISQWYDMKKLFMERFSGYAFPFAVQFSRGAIASDRTLTLRGAEGKPGWSRFGQSWFRP